MVENEEKHESSRTDEEINRVTGAVIGAATIIGAALGPVGALIGGVAGYLLADHLNKLKQKAGG